MVVKKFLDMVGECLSFIVEKPAKNICLKYAGDVVVGPISLFSSDRLSTVQLTFDFLYP